MSLSDSDLELITAELGREPTRTELALFENLWSEHCAYRSSRPLLAAFDSDGEQVVVGPGDDAAVVRLPLNPDLVTETAEEMYVTLGIESHNHPSYVDPFDGAATGVGGIVRDTMSMGAYPIALVDSLYFGDFDDRHTKYLFEGVVEGISHYGNCIGVPTVGGSVNFHPGFEGNPLVNVGCVGLLPASRLITAEARTPGNALVLVGNATGRDGLGGASFASEDLSEDAETADRPAVQVGDPYAEKRLIEANEQLLDEELVVSARDLGAAGLGGATSEMVAKGRLGAEIELERVHQREPNMTAVEILLAESQERMCYEVRPNDVDRVIAVADRFGLGSSVIGSVTEDRYVCTFDGEPVVDVDARFIGDGAPVNDLERESAPESATDLPDVDLERAVDGLLSSPNTASKRWVYRQYDHEVGVRTVVPPGDDAALIAIRECGVGLGISADAAPYWTDADPFAGAAAIALENATNLAVKGTKPLAAVDCLNGGNPETPRVYDGFARMSDGLASMCADLDVPIVGGNVSLYNDSPTGPIPPSPTVMMVGTAAGYDAPTIAARPDGRFYLIGDPCFEGAPISLGGSEFLARFGGSDAFPAVPTEAKQRIETLRSIARHSETVAMHDVSHGGLLVAIAEMVSPEVGISVSLPEGADTISVLAHERPGRAIVQTTDPTSLQRLCPDDTPIIDIGEPTSLGSLEIQQDGQTIIERSAVDITDRRSTIDTALE